MKITAVAVLAVLLAGCATTAPEPEANTLANTIIAMCEARAGKEQPAFNNCMIQQLQVFTAIKAQEERDSSNRRAILGAALIGAGNGLRQQPQPQTRPLFCQPNAPYVAPIGGFNCH